MSSARDEPPDTVPPPAGEEDAYSAATKVGAMPAELMARLRAEGLLPDEPAEPQRPPPPRPSAALAPRPSPRPSAQPTGFDEVPVLESDLPPRGESAPMISVPPPAGVPSFAHEQPAPAGVTPVVPPPIETPVAFVSPPSTDPIAGPVDGALAARSAGSIRPPRRRSTLRTLAVLFAALVALVGFAFAMARLSRRS